MELLHAKDVSFVYPGQHNPALDCVNLTVTRGSFHVICGASGCGKTTLIRLLKPELRPKGMLTGQVFYKSSELYCEYPGQQAETAAEIGFVRQVPETQIVTDKVWHELAFGLENLGVPREQIRVRVGETANFFGIQNWFRQDTMTLSGGQKQLLNLASVMVMQPKLLILDEPTSQLDPIAASEFIQMLGRLNRELGLTVLIVEHRLDQVLPLCDRLSVMDKGKIIFTGSPEETALSLLETVRDSEAGARIMRGFPTAARLFYELEGTGEEKRAPRDCPISVADGRRYLAMVCPEPSFHKWETTGVEQCIGGNAATVTSNAPDRNPEVQKADKPDAPVIGKSDRPNAPAIGKSDKPDAPGGSVLFMSDVWFRYEKDSADILRGMNFSLRGGEIYSLLGGNGSGKTTMLQVASGLRKAYKGKILILGKKQKEYKNDTLYRGMLAYLPQNPASVFLMDTVREDYEKYWKALQLPEEVWEKRLRQLGEYFGIASLFEKHPYDLSGGEQQKCALAKLLVTRPRLLLLDEPTKGLDAYGKECLGELLRKLSGEGLGILLVTHDVEFAAEYSHRCGLFFDGEILSEGVPSDFFSANQFYTTEAKRISQGTFEGTVTFRQLLQMVQKNRKTEHSTKCLVD